MSIQEGSLVTDVKHFQQRHGLEPNGIIDSHTFSKLNTPLSERVAQIETRSGMMALASSQQFLNGRLIVVNIPEFRLYAVNDEYISDARTHEASWSVCSDKHQTPVFATGIDIGNFSPPWLDVPLDIQRKEIFLARIGEGSELSSETLV